ncbi:hypothetical protein OH77DRAFT_1110145 [Trametes cingulata]|nr:hypothetical protein OH77DRAFT_1110145 [Trametes cingulata]
MESPRTQFGIEQVPCGWVTGVTRLGRSGRMTERGRWGWERCGRVYSEKRACCEGVVISDALQTLASSADVLRCICRHERDEFSSGNGGCSQGVLSDVVGGSGRRNQRTGTHSRDKSAVLRRGVRAAAENQITSCATRSAVRADVHGVMRRGHPQRSRKPGSPATQALGTCSAALATAGRRPAVA